MLCPALLSFCTRARWVLVDTGMHSPVLFVFKSGNFCSWNRRCCCCITKWCAFQVSFSYDLCCRSTLIEQHSMLFCILRYRVSRLILLFVACCLALGCSFCAQRHDRGKAHRGCDLTWAVITKPEEVVSNCS